MARTNTNTGGGGGGGGFGFGLPAVGFTNDFIQYVDNSGNQYGDGLATRDSTTLDTIIKKTNTNVTASPVIGNIVPAPIPGGTFIGVPPVTYTVVIDSVNNYTAAYTGLAGGTFSPGDTITCTFSGCTFTVVTDNGVNGMTITNVVGSTFIGDTMDNGLGVTAFVGAWTGLPDTFSWSDGGAPVTDVPITGAQQALNNGVTVDMGNTTGNTVGQSATWTYVLNTFEYGYHLGVYNIVGVLPIDGAALVRSNAALTNPTAYIGAADLNGIGGADVVAAMAYANNTGYISSLAISGAGAQINVGYTGAGVTRHFQDFGPSGYQYTLTSQTVGEAVINWSMSSDGDIYINSTQNGNVFNNSVFTMSHTGEAVQLMQSSRTNEFTGGFRTDSLGARLSFGNYSALPFANWTNTIAVQETGITITNDDTLAASVPLLDILTNGNTYLYQYTGVVGAATMVAGGGLNDATSGGTYTRQAVITYLITIDSVGVTDTFIWSASDGSSGGSTAMTGLAQNLSNGVTVTFAATTGHTLADQWQIIATFSSGIQMSLTGGSNFEYQIGDLGNVHNGTRVLISDNSQWLEFITAMTPVMIVAPDFFSWGFGQLASPAVYPSLGASSAAFCGSATDPLEWFVLGLVESGNALTQANIRTTNARNGIDTNHGGGDLGYQAGLSTGNVVGGEHYFYSNIAGIAGSTINTRSRFAIIGPTVSGLGDLDGVGTLGAIRVFSGVDMIEFTSDTHNSLRFDGVLNKYEFGDVDGMHNQTTVVADDANRTILLNASSRILIQSDTLDLQGGPKIKHRTITDAIVTINTQDWMVTGAGLTVDRVFTLPACTGATLNHLVVIANKFDSIANIILTPTGADTIAGAATVTITPGNSVTVVAGTLNDYEII